MNAGTDGVASLVVDHVDHLSTVTTAYARTPLKLLLPRPRGLSVSACTSNFGGGIVAGDSTRLEVRLHPDTRCLLGTQASTKIYRGPQQRPSTHQTVAHLGDRSLLVFAPDPIQPFAQSTYRQSQRFHLGEHAGLVLVDALSSGRPARGERWQFDEFSSRNEVWSGSERVFLDSLRLDSRSLPLTAPFRAGRHDCLALVAVLGTPFRETTRPWVDSLNRIPPSPTSPLVHALSPHPLGAILRVAGDSIERVTRFLLDQLGFLQPLLADSPWSRRW